MINDADGKLVTLNKKIKAVVHQLNNTYKNQYSKNLYDIAKSEQFAFMPHMGIGRIRIGSIKNHINNKSEINSTLGRIRKKIEQESSQTLEKILHNNNQITFDTFGILDPKNDIYIKEWFSRKTKKL